MKQYYNRNKILGLKNKHVRNRVTMYFIYSINIEKLVVIKEHINFIKRDSTKLSVVKLSTIQ